MGERTLTSFAQGSQETATSDSTTVPAALLLWGRRAEIPDSPLQGSGPVSA